MACGCSNIAIMQLFHRLKQDFPAAPDEVVMQCIRQHAHDSEACERALRRLQGGRQAAFMVHTHAHADSDTHACPMTGTASTAGVPLQGLQGRPSHANHSAPGLGKGGWDASPLRPAVAQVSSPDVAAPAAAPGPVKSTASVQLATRKRRPAPPPPTAAAASPAVSPAPSPRPSPRPSPTPSRPAPPPPATGSLPQRVYLNGPSEAAASTACSSAALDSRAPFPVPPVRHRSPASPASPVGRAGEAPGRHLDVPAAPYPGAPQASSATASTTTPPFPPPRHLATMDILPAAPFGLGVEPTRSYTTVQMTLRPPGEQPRPSLSEGSPLMYSTSSFDPRGWRSKLEIQFANGLGSISAMRHRVPVLPTAGPQAPGSPQAGAVLYSGVRRPPPRPPAPAPSPCMEPLAEEAGALEAGPLRASAASREELEKMVVAMETVDFSADMREHLMRQLERRALLETELLKERAKLQLMQREVAEMERDLERRTRQARPRAPPALPLMEKVQSLRSEIQSLQEECSRMANEVDAKTSQNRFEDASSERGWTCQTCTFHNHYLLEACETCDVPRMRLGRDNGLADPARGPRGPRGRADLHALGLSGFPPPSIIPSLATPALESALAPLALTPNPTAMCVPNMLSPSPGHEE